MWKICRLIPSFCISLYLAVKTIYHFFQQKIRIYCLHILQGVLKKKSCHSYIVGGACNHIHIITHIHPTICPAYLIKDIKEATHAMILREKIYF